MARRSIPSPLANPLREITTPATLYTREIGFAVRVSIDSSKKSRLPILGQTYQAAAISQVRMTEFKNYICTHIPEGQGGPYIDVFFSLNKTAAQAWTPFADPEHEFRNHSWPIELVN